MSEHDDLDLSAKISQWASEVTTKHPSLETHLTELIDHVHTMVEHETAAGMGPHQAFANAIQTLGDPEQLAAQFRSADRQAARCALFGQSVQQRRARVLIAATYIVFSVGWAGFVLATNELGWMLAGWTVTTLLPLSVLGGIASLPASSEDARSGS